MRPLFQPRFLARSLAAALLRAPAPRDATDALNWGFGADEVLAWSDGDFRVDPACPILVAHGQAAAPTKRRLRGGVPDQPAPEKKPLRGG
jgi:hypothetical protein